MKNTLESFLKGSKTHIILIFLVACLVRLIGIASRPIWYDEAFSVLFSEKGVAQMLYGTLTPTGAGSADIHPLGYYTLVWLWMKLFGESVSSIRLLSVFAGLIVVCLVYLISLELFDVKTAKLAMLISALSPFQIHYAQEVRMYVFLALWLALASYTYLCGVKSGNWRWWLAFGFVSALAQYTHNLAAFFLIPLAITPVFKRDWKTLRSVLLSSCFALLLYLPWLIQLPAQIAKINQAYWVTKPGIGSLFTLLLVFTMNTPLPNTWIPPALVLAISIISIAIMLMIRLKGNALQTNGIWTLYLSFAPPALLFLFSQWKPVYIERALLPSGAFFCIWLAWVLNHSRPIGTELFILSGSIFIAFAVGIYQHATYKGFPYGPFKEIDSNLSQQIRPGDLILHSNKLSILPAIYFDRNLPQTFIADPPGSTIDTLAPATQEVLNIKSETDIKSAVNGVDRVWYIIYQRSIDEFTRAGKNTHPDVEFLASAYTLVSQETWDDLKIFHFIKQP